MGFCCDSVSLSFLPFLAYLFIYEILTDGELPYKEYEALQAAQAVLEGRTLINDIRPDCPPKLKKILADCWKKNPDKRPEMKDIIARLHEVQVNSLADSHYTTVPTDVTK
jgi:hypothetical protein